MGRRISSRSAIRAHEATAGLDVELGIQVGACDGPPQANTPATPCTTLGASRALDGQAACDGVTVVIGDSTTVFEADVLQPSENYWATDGFRALEDLQEAYSRLVGSPVLLRSVSGSTSNSFLDQLEHVGQETHALARVVLVGGWNDKSRGDEDIKASLAALEEKAKEFHCHGVEFMRVRLTDGYDSTRDEELEQLYAHHLPTFKQIPHWRGEEGPLEYYFQDWRWFEDEHHPRGPLKTLCKALPQLSAPWTPANGSNLEPDC